MPIQEIIYANLLPGMALLMLIVFAVKNSMFNRYQTFIFISAVTINLVMLVAVSLDFVFSQSSISYIYHFRRMTSFLNFAASPLIPLFLIMLFKEKKLPWYYYLPFIVNLVICFISIFVPNVVFFITARNKYARGVLFFLPFVISILYVILFMFQKIGGQSRSKRNERYYLLYVLFTLGLSMFLEIVYQYRFLSWVSCAIGLILYYLLLNIQNIIIDPLTGCYNRLFYNRELELMNRRIPGLIALIDINGFKQINDLRGHDEGDRVLIRFVGIMHKNISSFGKVYRIGGDEFVLTTRKMNYNYFVNAIEYIRIAARQQGIEFACGVIEYKATDEIQDILKQADAIMYANKNQQKKETDTSDNDIVEPGIPTQTEQNDTQNN